MTKFDLNAPALHAYLIDDSLLIYSETTQNVYGFEGESAALFLEIDNLIHNSSFEAITQSFPLADDKTLKIMVDFAKGYEPDSSLEYEQDLRVDDYPRIDKKSRFLYLANDITFAIHYPTKEVFDKLHPVFVHLYKHQSSSKKIAIDLIQHGNHWDISFNGQTVGVQIPDPQLATFLQEKMVTYTYQSQPYLIALHAAAVEYNGSIFIFPATAESGKTTLTAILLGKGFKLFSDENSVLDEQGKILPLPFCLNIKEGSWEVVAKSHPFLDDQPFHHRFDNQKIKFLNPTNLYLGRKKVTHIIFPKYKPASPFLVRSVSAVETLAKIREASYQIQNNLCLEKFEALIENLLVLPAYSMEYSNTDDAMAFLVRIDN